MNKILIFLLFPIFVFSQIIKGKVTNSNNEPIEGASVYLDGTTIGTLSDNNGLFEINASNKYNTLLIVRFLGYEDIILSNPYEKDFYTFILVPKTNEIEDCVSTTSGIKNSEGIVYKHGSVEILEKNIECENDPIYRIIKTDECYCNEHFDTEKCKSID